MANSQRYTTALLVLGLLASGCSSGPSVDALTKPTMEAFVTLSSWRPFEREERPLPFVVTSAPINEDVVVAGPAEPIIRPTTGSKPMHQANRQRPSAVGTVVTQASTHALPRPLPTASPPLTAVTCRTTTSPGQRVSMECVPVERN